MTEGLLNVLECPRAGLLDEISQDETDRDLAAILAYIRAEERALATTPGRGKPSIARSVLMTFWQKPRTGFHRQEIEGRKGVDFRSKLLLVPWSIEAFDRCEQQKNVRGLILEHVTPIDAIWKSLLVLRAESESDAEWAGEAQAYLRANYALAVLTKEQAYAIDAVGLQTVGFKGKPFLRYHQAAERIRDNEAAGGPSAGLDVARFTHPGLCAEDYAEELAREDESRDGV